MQPYPASRLPLLGLVSRASVAGMSWKPAKYNATYADIEALPAGVNGELIDGELWVTPRPASPHARASMEAGTILNVRFGIGEGGPGGWQLLFEPELHFDADVLVPDIAGWRIERMPTVPNVAAFRLPPDWICETVSPSTARLDRVRKLPRYHRNGVAWAWIVDPVAKSLEVYRAAADGFELVQTFAGAELVRARPFDSVEIELGRWWTVAAAPSDAARP